MSNGGGMIQKPQMEVAAGWEGMLDVVQRTAAAGTTPEEFGVFAYQAKKTGLDPLARQIYCLRLDGRMSIMASIDGLRLVAQRSGEYAGQMPAAWCGLDGVWKDVWLGDKPPAAARVGVHRRGFVEPLVAVARWSDYARPGRDGKRSNWDKMPDVMLAKCAEALALRRAFPQELSGIYSPEEMEQAEPERKVAPPVNAEVKPKLIVAEEVKVAKVDTRPPKAEEIPFGDPEPKPEPVGELAALKAELDGIKDGRTANSRYCAFCKLHLKEPKLLQGALEVLEAWKATHKGTK